MDYLFYNIKQVFIGSDGEIKEKTVKRTRDEGVAESFMEISKQLKPEDKFYVFTTLED